MGMPGVVDRHPLAAKAVDIVEVEIVDRFEVPDQRPDLIRLNGAQGHPGPGDAAAALPDDVAIGKDQDSIDRAAALAIAALQGDDQVIRDRLLSRRDRR